MKWCIQILGSRSLDTFGIMKAIYTKPTTTIFSDEKLKLSSQDQEQNKGAHLHHSYSAAITQGKKISTSERKK